jgi:phosphopantetheinyl transferase (holo-ACP synthase)
MNVENLNGMTDKLRLKKHVPLLLVNAPTQAGSLFADFSAQHETGDVAQSVLFVSMASDLAGAAPALVARLKDDAVFWIMYPKKTSCIPTNLTRDKGWEVVFNMGYEPVTSAAIDADWTALRFKKKEAIGKYTRSIPMADRQAEGIDFKTQTVILPADAQQAVNEYADVAAYFNQLAFTHKKEYVVAITNAKRPETRAARITQMVTVLKQKMIDQKK